MAKLSERIDAAAELLAVRGFGVLWHDTAVEWADAARALEAEVERLRNALWRYGRHEYTCDVVMAYDGPGTCDCGLRAACFSPAEQAKAEEG